MPDCLHARAAVLRAPGETPDVEDVVLDAPRPGEVLVRLAGTGICHTDLLALDGALGLPLPCVVGHEGAGVVEQVGEGVTTHAPGDHVVLSFDSCGACATCRAGRPAYCERFAALNSSGHRADGTTTLGAVHGSFCGQSSFASHALASTRNAVAVPADLPIERLGPLGCGVMTGAGTVLEVLRPQEGSALAVFGLGTVGLAAVMAARVAGCSPIVGVDPDPARRALATELGATEVLEAGEPRALARAIRQLTGGGVAASVDTVGTGEVVDAALRVLRSPGTCATVALRGPRNPVTIDQSHLLYGRTLTGVIEGDVDPQEFIPRLVALHRDGALPFDRLVTTFPFETGLADAVDAARRGTAIKPVLTFA